MLPFDRNVKKVQQAVSCIHSKQRTWQLRFHIAPSLDSIRHKPIELATHEDRLSMQKKEYKQNDFFVAME